MRALALPSSEAATPIKKWGPKAYPVPVSPLFLPSASANPSVIQRKASCACGGGCPRCDTETEQNLAFQDPAPQPKPDENPPVSPPATKPAASCPTFVSLTATVGKPRVSDTCKADKCRLEIGCCPTPRGECGTTKDSGAAFKGTIDVPSGCTGELGFLQNLLSTDRRRTLSDKSKECVNATSAHIDGGVPWKGCKIAATSAGTYTIETDDCPYLLLDDTMTAASVADSFKMYLIWKGSGDKGWKAIGSVSWNWSASTVRQKGKDCASNWSSPGGAAAKETGGASTEQPVGSPKVQDVLGKWKPCDKKE